MRLQGMKAAVTGGGSGIGAGIGMAYAREGADVAFLDIDAAHAEQYAQEANALYGGNCIAAKLDVTDRASVADAFGTVEKTFGQLDALVCSAGISYILPFMECTEEIWDKTMDVNLKGMFLCVQQIMPMMLKQQSGSIICLSSQSGKMGASHYQAYCASKFGVIGFVQSLAMEFAGVGIRVNALCPGVVLTPMWDKQVESYAKKRNLKAEEVMPYFESKIPLKRLGTIADVAALAVYLASNESTYITGQSLNIAGGQIMF